MTRFQPFKKPLLNDKIVISILLEEQKLKELDELAGKTDISRNELINQCIEFALNNLEENDIRKENGTKN